jgi:hypothetical protein
MPTSMLIGAALIGLSGLITTFYPPTQEYLSGRVDLGQALQQALNLATRSTSNGINLLKYEIALIVVPAVLVLGCSSIAFARKLAAAWVAGIVISNLIALTDHIGMTDISVSLLGYGSITEREAGLTSQPNFIGVESTMAIPILMLSFAGGRRFWPAVGTVLCLEGVYLSGSRGSSVGVVIAVLVTLLAAPTARRWAGRIFVVVLAATVYLLATSGGGKILAFVRLTTSDQSVAASDAQRTSVRTQGFDDWHYRPINGIGWGHAADAHLIYLQLLAAGGMLALVGFTLYVGGTLRIAWTRERSTDPLVGALIASVATWLIIGLVENQLTDQWTYVPIGLLAVVIAIGRSKVRPQSPGSDRPATSRR